MKTPSQSTLINWLDSIEKQGYKRIKLRSLLEAFGAKRRGPALMADIDAALAGLLVGDEECPLKVEWERAEDLDDSVRIVAADASDKPAPAPTPKAKLAAAPAPKAKPVAAAAPDGTILRAISIRQPFVEEILDGIKPIEYRTRPTNIRETVYLYASLGMRPEEDFKENGYDPDKCPRGVIVGTVDIVDCTFDGVYYNLHLANPVRLVKFLKPTNHAQPMFWRPQFKK
jgi:hypothetical protein